AAALSIGLYLGEQSDQWKDSPKDFKELIRKAIEDDDIRSRLREFSRGGRIGRLPPIPKHELQLRNCTPCGDAMSPRATSSDIFFQQLKSHWAGLEARRVAIEGLMRQLGESHSFPSTFDEWLDDVAASSGIAPR
ncbi:MAG TPA: hypothetical protein PKD61_26565, partial [Polyangiaceae bacterium]|nr:hypothetical protein [Polyangiaceae bacterium]